MRVRATGRSVTNGVVRASDITGVGRSSGGGSNAAARRDGVGMGVGRSSSGGSEEGDASRAGGGVERSVGLRNDVLAPELRWADFLDLRQSGCLRGDRPAFLLLRVIASPFR